MVWIALVCQFRICQVAQFLTLFTADHLTRTYTRLHPYAQLFHPAAHAITLGAKSAPSPTSFMRATFAHTRATARISSPRLDYRFMPGCLDAVCVYLTPWLPYRICLTGSRSHYVLVHAWLYPFAPFGYVAALIPHGCYVWTHSRCTRAQHRPLRLQRALSCTFSHTHTSSWFTRTQGSPLGSTRRLRCTACTLTTTTRGLVRSLILPARCAYGFWRTYTNAHTLQWTQLVTV